ASTSRRTSATTPTVTAVERADSTCSRASPSSSRSLASMSSRVMRSRVGWPGIGVTCSGLALAGDARQGPGHEQARHGEDDEVRQPGEVAVEGVAGLGLPGPEAAKHQKDDADVEEEGAQRAVEQA